MKQWPVSEAFRTAMLRDWANVQINVVSNLETTQSCESPIEAMFLIAFRLVTWGDLRRPYRIKQQAIIGNHRVDFLISLNARSCVVECDGRDFHHASWEQLESDRERDAEIEALGHKVFRFPGTQIHNHPIDCVMLVIDYLLHEEQEIAA